MLVSERLSDYSSSRQALTHAAAGVGGWGGNTPLSHLQEATGTGRPCFAALRQQMLPLFAFDLNKHLSARFSY